MIRRPPRSTRTDHSFPTRRSSDLLALKAICCAYATPRGRARRAHARTDRRRESGASGYVEDLELRSEEHTSELQSLMRISYAVFCLKKKNITTQIYHYSRE